MISYDTKLKLKDIMLCLGEEELAIEKLRQMLASIKDFEPYAAFKRIDRDNKGYLTSKQICQYLRENGYREFNKEDFTFMVQYFDTDGDMRVSYHDFLQILLPCDDAFLRAAATQRPNRDVAKNEFLPMRVERALSQLLMREAKLHLRVENMKRSLEAAYDYNVRIAFKAIDDWNYNYIDDKNLRRFLRNMGHLATKADLVAIIRRFDTDGDAKINAEEFKDGIKSHLSVNTPYSSLKKQKQSGSSFQLSKSAQKYSENQNKIRSKIQSSIQRPQTPTKITSQKQTKKRPSSANNATNIYKQRQRLINEINRLDSKYGNSFNEQSREDSASRLNRSVTFNNQVRVREYDNSQEKSKLTPHRLQEQSYENNNRSPLKTFMPSPLREEPLIRDQNLYRSQYNRNDSSPLRSHVAKSLEKSLGYDNVNGSPLIVKQSTTDSYKIPSQYTINQQSAQKTLISPSINTSQQFDRIEQGEVAKIFKDSIFLERELESVKIELTLKPDFNLLDAFRIIDLSGKGFITAQDLIENLHIVLLMDSVSRDDVYLFFRRYDTTSAGKINYAEFCHSFTPVCKEYASLLASRQDFYLHKNINPQEYFTAETRNEIKNLWKTLFQTERATECLRVRIARRSNFQIKSAFQYCDKDLDGQLSREDVKNMLAEHSFFATDRELNSIMYKMDADKDGFISFAEFIKEVSPKLSAA